MNALDREVLDELHDRPDLLAVADAVATTQERRRRPLAALAPLVAVAAVVALFLVAPWQNHGPNIFDSALAAVGTEPVIHAVVEYSWPRDVVVNLATGEEHERVHRNEYWYDEQRYELHELLSTDSGAPSDYLIRDPSFASLDPALTGFATEYRDALENHSARVVGDSDVNGRHAKRIEFAASPGGSVETVTVDADTFVPLAFQYTYPGGRRSPEWRVAAIESLPYDASDFTPVETSRTRPLSGLVDEGRNVSHAEAARALGRQPLDLGREADSVQLFHTHTELTGGRKVSGEFVRLTYGDVHVSLARSRAGAYAIGFGEGEFPTPPEGSIGLTGDRYGWQGELRKDGFAVLVAARTKSQVVATARRLTPLR